MQLLFTGNISTFYNYDEIVHIILNKSNIYYRPRQKYSNILKNGILGCFELFASKGQFISGHFWQAKIIGILENNLMAYITDLLSGKKECFQWKICRYLKFLRGQTPPRKSRTPIYPKLRSKIPYFSGLFMLFQLKSTGNMFTF